MNLELCWGAPQYPLDFLIEPRIMVLCLSFSHLFVVTCLFGFIVMSCMKVFPWLFVSSGCYLCPVTRDATITTWSAITVWAIVWNCRILVCTVQKNCAVFGGGSTRTFVRRVNLATARVGVQMVNGLVIASGFLTRDRHMGRTGSFAAR